MPTKRIEAIREALRAAYAEEGLWGERRPAHAVPAGLERGSDAHLAYLTLVYTLSGGRDPVQVWSAAGQTLAENPRLFEPQYLAYADPADLREPLHAHALTQKPKSEATVWQRIGQALVMRGQGSVHKILSKHDFDALELRQMLRQSKTTFPVLSGEQTAPRWLHGLAAHGDQPLKRVDQLALPASPAAARALEALQIETGRVTAAMFDPLQALGRRGCAQRPEGAAVCPVWEECPVAKFCKYKGRS